MTFPSFTTGFRPPTDGDYTEYSKIIETSVWHFEIFPNDFVYARRVRDRHSILVSKHHRHTRDTSRSLLLVPPFFFFLRIISRALFASRLRNLHIKASAYWGWDRGFQLQPCRVHDNKRTNKVISVPRSARRILHSNDAPYSRPRLISTSKLARAKRKNFAKSTTPT